MLSSAKIGTSSWRYYQNQVARGACEYYLGAGEAPGRWHGRGLAELGLVGGGRVDEQQLEALFGRALHPVTGTRLGRVWRLDGVTGFDLTLSTPKSVSALWAFGNSHISKQLEAAHAAAVEATLGYLDAHAAFSRRGRDGTEQLPSAGLTTAVFDHRTSRAGDPQLHSHALVVNRVHCIDGVWRTLDGHEIYHHKKSAGILYQAALRAELRSRLGVEFTPVTRNGQAEIAGVPDALIEAWSKRTTEITKEAAPKIVEFEEKLGRALTSAERISVTKTAVLKTRTAKEHAPASVLHARWRDEAARLGWTPDRLCREVVGAVHRIRVNQPRTPLSVGRLMVDAVTAAGRAQATFSRADLAAEIALRITAARVCAEQVRATVERLTDTGLARGGAVLLGAPRYGETARRSDPRYATRELLAAEARILHRAEHRQQAGYGVASADAVTQHIGQARLDADQSAAVRAATLRGDAITVITAPAGAGKTTTLGAAARIWTDSGYTVLGLAPSARAAAELGRATGGTADTVAKWLYDQRPGTRGLGERPTSRPLDARTVLIVDEASMCSTHDLDWISAAAEAGHAKVVLVGDPAQIGVVQGPGGILATLANRTGSIELTGVHRFTQDWERAASLDLRRGDPCVLDQYLAHGRIHPAGSDDGALDALFTAWATATAQGQDALMMARSRADVDRLNTRARDAAHQAGSVHGPVMQIGRNDWQAGDLLRARRNNRRIPVGTSHVRNGDRFRVLGPGIDGGLLVDDLTGQGRTTLPASYVTQHAQYGWASTIDGAQGATADIGLLLVRAGLDREHLYVGMTRGRHANHAHIAPNSVDDDARRVGPPPQPFTMEGARQVLVHCLTRIGGQQAAHTVLDEAQRARREAVTASVVQERPEPEHQSDGYEQALRRYQNRLREHERLALDVMLLDRRTRITEQQLHDLPRWRRPGPRTELTTQLNNDRQQLDTARERLDHLHAELPALKKSLDGWRSQPAKRQSQTTPTSATTNPAPRAHVQPMAIDRYGSTNRPAPPAVPELHQTTGYGIER